MLFSGIHGQQIVKDKLLCFIKNKNVPPALVFNGPQGCGKFPLAIAFSRILLCKNVGDMDACGECSSCLKVDKLTHPDLHIIYPLFDKDRIGEHTESADLSNHFRTLYAQNAHMEYEDWLEYIRPVSKSGIISRGQCANLITKIYMSSYEGGYKIVVFWVADLLGESANLFLKILEDPPPKTLFIFLSKSLEKILNTVLSRCILIPIPPFTDEDISEWYKRENLPSENHENFVRFSMGNIYLAGLCLKSNDVNHTNIFISFIRISYKNSTSELVQWLDEIIKYNRGMILLLLDYSMKVIRNIFLSNMGFTTYNSLSEEELEFSNKFSKYVSDTSFRKYIEAFSLASKQIQSNANIKIVFHCLFFKLHKIISDVNH
jgi:DNA polymerase-3 subunit delta'